MANDSNSWTDLIKRSVYTSDDQDIGDIEAVSRNFIVVKKGLVNIRRYYIPLHRVEGWDGNAVWLKIPEELVMSSYERDAPPDPLNYHYSDAPLVDGSNVLTRFQIILPQIPPKNLEERPFVMAQETSEQSRRQQTFRCDLCNSTLSTDDELSSHIALKH